MHIVVELHEYFTMAVDFVLPSRNESLVEAYHKWRAWADPKVCCDYTFHVGVTWWGPKVIRLRELIASVASVSRNTFILSILALSRPFWAQG
jgi:dihydroorotase-like cyclic amidohydrolase